MITLPARGELKSTRLFVDRAGTPSLKPPLFLLPGGPGGNSTHFASYRCLQDRLEMVFFDPRGCGLSDKEDTVTYTLDNYINDIEAIRTALGLEKISLLGKSYSGLCALGYALRYPHAVDKLILVATGPSYRFVATAKERLVQIASPAQIDASEKLWDGRFNSSEEVEEYFQLMAPLYSTTASSSQPQAQGEVRPFAHEPLNRGFQTDLRTVDFAAELNKIVCPTLIMTGDNDWIFDQRYSKEMAASIPQSKLVIFENAGHFLEDDAREKYYAELLSFLA